MSTKAEIKYSDIINLPHHVSSKYKPMSIEARSAQFAPFAALTGYNDELAEAERTTSPKIELTENAKEILDNKINYLLHYPNKNNYLKITYFIPDNKKEGGYYKTITTQINKIDSLKKIIYLQDNTSIPISNIIDIIID
ncbi:MAG TPA: hypothetical protein IAC02_06415 [Candidatus Coprovivens excrementavium]|nr:hypothetical protein [Candidatus Coprovivens excrementavium]